MVPEDQKKLLSLQFCVFQSNHCSFLNTKACTYLKAIKTNMCDADGH